MKPKRPNQSNIMLSDQELKLVNDLAEKYKGTKSQVFRIAISKLAAELKDEKKE